PRFAAARPPRPALIDWSGPRGRDEGIHSLGIYRPDGEHLLTLTLPPSVSPFYMSSDPETGRLFMHATDPYPQAIEYRLRQCAAEP
ncbi:MAG: hypothetical protein ACREM1_23640, partial [Longimicrobiales bacterium]